jgi:CRISPR-associated endonuclease/helicase Cas3
VDSDEPQFKARTNGSGKYFYESCEEHLAVVGALSGVFASSFGQERRGVLTGMLHDLGKYSDHFQEHITHPDKPMHVDHSTVGAQIAFKDIRCAQSAFAIAAHHSGLSDCGVQGEEYSFPERMRKHVDDCSAWSHQLTDVIQQSGLASQQSELVASYSMMSSSRMLLSCLVDADRLDAEYFTTKNSIRAERHLLEQVRDFLGGEDRLADEQPISFDEVEAASVRLGKTIKQQSSATFDGLLMKLRAHNEQLLKQAGSSHLNRLRCDILRRAIDAGRSGCPSTGVTGQLFTLTAPTGSGKTNASLSFALEYAKAAQKQRVIYVIPYMSIIDQTVASFSRLLGSENVLAHYSEAPWMLTDENILDQSVLRSRMAAENWNSPIVVTTAVQFFESLYSNRPSAVRKLHNIADSVIVFDEAQTLPIDNLWPCVTAISDLVQNYRVSAVLCTATQPELSSLFEKAVQDSADMIQNPSACAAKAITSLSEEEMRAFDRVHLEMLEHPITTDNLARIISNRHQTLCVVNTRREAIKLADAVVDHLGHQAGSDDGVFCLTTLQCADDRVQLLKEIRHRLKNGQPCRVVSTSLIEAGVDVDFPTAFRERAGLDSILQTAGRCNREGRRSKNDSIVTIFSLSDGGINPLIGQNISAFNAVSSRLGMHGDVGSNDRRVQYTDGNLALVNSDELMNMKSIKEYFTDLLHFRQGRLNADPEESFDTGHVLEKREILNPYAFKQMADRFHLINNIATTIYIPVNEEAKKLCSLLAKYPERLSRLDYRKAGRYAVQVYQADCQKLLNAGVLLPVGISSDSRIYMSQSTDNTRESSNQESYILSDIKLYDRHRGLKVPQTENTGVFL